MLGIGGILVYALALDGFARRQRYWWIWIAALSLICWALILDYSRAGIILLVGGVAAWHLFWLITSGNKRRPLIASAGILLLLLLFAWNGGKTIMRFIDQESDFLSPSNMRFAIYRDALDLTTRAPFTGIGLPNFSYVFSTAQTHSVGEDVAAHPESDWLWTAVELGWLAPLLIAALFVWWLSRCFPFEPGTYRLLRFAAMVCGCGFTLHAFFDVPGHHIGAILPTLLLAGTALHPHQPFKFSGVISTLFRLTGIVLLFGAVFSFLSIGGSPNFPTDVTVDRWQKQIARALDEDEYESASNMASRALGIEPLEWNLYYQRAVAEVGLHSRTPAKRDFAIARYFFPNGLIFGGRKERPGHLPARSMKRSRAGPECCVIFRSGRLILYGDIYGSIKDEPELVDRWRLLGRDDKKCLLAFFNNATPVEFAVELDHLLADDPNLNRSIPPKDAGSFKLGTIMATGWNLSRRCAKNPIGERSAGNSLLALMPIMAIIRMRARPCANSPRYRRFPTLRPVLPLPISNSKRGCILPTSTLLRHFASRWRRKSEVDQALARLQALHGVKGFPDYLRNLEAKLWEGKAEWGKAWNALKPFVSG